jgi:hypothetical protein
VQNVLMVLKLAAIVALVAGGVWLAPAYPESGATPTPPPPADRSARSVRR